jgi:hypothetical protein
MKEEIIKFQTAKLAKEKGFNNLDYSKYFYTNLRSKMFGIDEENRTYPIVNKSKKLYTVGCDLALYLKNIIEAPTQSLLQKWLREKHNIIVLLEPVLGFSHIEFSMSIYTKKNIFSLTKFHVSSNKTYEEALEAGLIEGLKLIKGL